MKPLLRTVILVALIPMLVAITAFQAWRVHASIYDVILEGFDRTLRATGHSVASRLDGDKHRHLQQLPPDAVANEEGYTRYFDAEAPFFTDHRKLFSELREALGLTYLYTQVHLQDDQIYYVLDGSSEEDWVAPGSADVLPPESVESIREVQLLGKPWVTDLLQWENWGLIKASYTPIRDRSGKIVAMVGADIESSIVKTKTRQALFAVLSLGLMSIIVSVLVSIWISRTLTRPIDEIRDAALSIAAGNLPSKPLRARIREVNQLATTLEQLNSRLQEQRAEVIAYQEILKVARRSGIAPITTPITSGSDGEDATEGPDSTTKRLFALHQIQPFNQLPATELTIVADSCKRRSDKASTLLCPAGYVPDYLFLVLEGSIVDASGKDQGRIVGAHSQLKGEPIEHDMKAGPNGCVSLVMPRGKFLTLAQNRPQLITAMPTLESSSIS